MKNKMNEVVLRPKNVVTDFGYNNQMFSCDVSFKDRFRMLFKKRVWFKMHGSHINRLAKGMGHNGMPFDPTITT